MPRRRALLPILCFAALLALPAPASAAAPSCPGPHWITTTPSAGVVARVWASSCDLKAREGSGVRVALRSKSAGVKIRYRVNAQTEVQLLRLPSNRIVVTQSGADVVITARGRRVRTLKWAGADWTALRARVNRARKRVELRLDRRLAMIRLRKPRRERRAEVGVVLSAPTPGGAPGTPAAAPPAVPQSSAPAPAGSTQRLFAPDSVWNARFDGNVELASNSGALVAELRRSVEARTPWINTTNYSVPVYRVGPHQPAVRVQLNTSWSLLQSQWDAVPLPANALPAQGSDGHLVVYQPSTDTLWEFFKLARNGSQWSARWGGRIVGVSKSPGYYYGAERHHGATATSLSLAGGLMTIAELKAGRIDHALALAVPYARRGVFVWPAQRGDGYVTAENAIPEGTRFRLDPSFDVTTVKGPPIIRMMAEAAQRYGMVVRDQSAGVTFYAEDPRQFGMNPFSGPSGFYQGQFANNILRKFPWTQLQVVAPKKPASAARRRAKVHP